MRRRGTPRTTTYTILLVDDQQDTLQSVGSLLSREGHRVLTAESGPEALRVVKANDVHLVIVDYFMPRMNGADLVREIRSFDPYVQIILQTGYAGERPPRVVLAELDIQGYHDKADDPERLLLWVDVALKAYRMVHMLRERERLQSDLVANCSHEFRTPLNVIMGYAELLLAGDSGPLNDQVTQQLRGVDSAARDLTHLVEDFLQYAKAEAGAIEVLKERVDLTQLAREKPVLFTAVVDPGVPAVFTDGVKLRTIVRNLVINAAKFTETGTIELRMRLETDGLVIEVQDSGPGIRPEDHELIFEPFRQLDGSSTRQHGGVGLGLALARKHARMLGGDVQVESQVGAGATFRLQLPAEVVGSHAAGVDGERSRLSAGA